jgi:hypothetical protein
VTAATVFDVVGERTEASAVDLTDEQLGDRGGVVVEGRYREVEVGREPPGGAGIRFSECGAALESDQSEDTALGQMTQQQILCDIDDRGVATLRRLGRRVAKEVALGQPDVVGKVHARG